MRTVGIVGGVGPEASNKFCELLVKRKSKKKDQDNIPFIHLCNPQIPDRTDFINGVGENPIPAIVETCQKLEQMNVDFIVIPCNTAHSFLPQIEKEIKTPIINMIKLTVKEIKLKNPLIKNVGILSTTGSIKTGLYKEYLGIVGINAILPTKIDQEILVMEAIYGKKGIKAGKKRHAKKLLLQASEKLIKEGADAIILGCTEIPLVLKQKDFGMKIYDPMEISAKEIIKYVESEKIINKQFIRKK